MIGRTPWAVLGIIALLGTLVVVILLAGHASADRVPHMPIYISGDGGFTPANGVVSGSGSAADPFVIEEYTISIAFGSGVYVEDTSAYYVLRNVTVLGQRMAGSSGIYLTNSTHAVVERAVVNATDRAIRVESTSTVVIDNCTVSNGGSGVTIEDCADVVVRNVAATGFQNGIRLRGCDSCDVDRCTSSGNTQNGIELGLSTLAQTEWCRVMGCNASLNRIGIYLTTTRRCEIATCVARNNSVTDVSLYMAGRTLMDGNTLGKGALFVSNYFEEQDVRDTNTVDGRPLRYLRYQDSLVLDSDVGQVYLVRCQNVTVANLTFDGINAPVTLYASESCTIVNCTIMGAFYAIMAMENGPVDIVGCRVERGAGGYATNMGIYLEECEANVTGTDVSGAQNGIIMNGIGTVRVANCTVGRCGNAAIYAYPSSFSPGAGGKLSVEGCAIRDSPYGVNSRYWTLTVRDVRLDNLTTVGIYLEREAGSALEGCNITRCPIGVRIANCRTLLVSSNVIAGGPGSTGIRLDSSSGTLRDNNVTGCLPAIYLLNSGDSTLLRNSVTGRGSGGQPGILVSNSPRTTVSGCEAFDLEVGIRLAASGYCEVTRCLVVNCTIGIELLMSPDSTVTECTVRGCSQLGIRAFRSPASEAHHNNLLLCNYDPARGSYRGRQAWDDSAGNYWDDGSEGNYWGDYLQWYPDAIANGKVWDTPYALNGTGARSDMFPLTLLYDFRPPVAVAGDDATVGENTTVTLDGSRSSDDIGIAGHVWRLTYGGQPVTLDGPVVQYLFGPLGTYEVTLTVRDAWGNTGSDKVLVRVVDKVPPVAVAGDDLTVNVDERFILDGTGSYDDHAVVSYGWSIDPGGLNLTSKLPVLVMSISMVGDYPVELDVTDAFGNSATDSLVVHVRDLTPPSAEAGPDVDIGQGELAHFNASGSKDNVGIVRWNWTFLYGGRDVFIDLENASFRFDVPGTYKVALTVWDAAGAWAQDILWVRVRDTEPPVAEAGPELWVGQGEVAGLIAAGSRDNVAILNYVWHVTVEGEDRWFNGERVDIVLFRAGEYPVALNVTDTSGNWARDTTVIHVADVTLPTASAGPDATVNQHMTVAFDGRSSDDDVGVVTYRWALVDGGVTFTFDAPVGSHTFDTVGTYEVTLTVADATGNAASDSFTVTVKDIEPPVAVSGGNRTAVEGTYVTLDASASRDNVGIALYRWAVVTANGTVFHSGAVYSFRVEGTRDLKAELWVEDAAGNAAIDDLIVTVLSMWVTFRLGPFLDQDGNVVEDADVTITLNGTATSGTTDHLGWAEVTVKRVDLVSPAGVDATKEGYERLEASVPLDGLGRPSGDLPAMDRIPALGLGSPLLLVLLLAIIAIVLGGVGVAVYRMSQQKRAGPSQ
jgi:parallel beta-helix repeat protein